MENKPIYNKKNLKEEFVNELVPGELYHFIHNDRILYGTFKGRTPAWLLFDVEGKEVLAKPWTNVATTAEELEEIMGIVDRMEKDTKIPSQVPNRFTRVPNQHNKPIGESNELEQRAKRHRKKSKGRGWHMSVNAGDVEKGIAMFNAAQPDGGIGAVSPVNGNAMGESVENDKPDWEGLKNHLKKYLKDKHLKWNISDIGEDAPNFGIGEDNYPEFFKILDSNNFGGTDKVNKLIDYIDNQIKNVNESFGYQMDNGMIEDSFYTFENDHLTYHFFFNPRRSEKGKYAILVVDYGIRFDKEPYTNEKGITTIPVNRVYDKPQQIAYFEFTEESHPEIANAMYEDDMETYRNLIVAETEKHMRSINEDVNEGNVNIDAQVSMQLEYLRRNAEDKYNKGSRREYENIYNYREYQKEIDRNGDKNLLVMGKFKDPYEFRMFGTKSFARRYRNSDLLVHRPGTGGEILVNIEDIDVINNVSEAVTSTKYSYTGPIYYLGNKISTKSKLFTTAKSWDQARNNIIFRIANGDTPSHYDIADTELRKIPETPISDMEPNNIQKCDICGYQLTDSGDCPVCDYGEEDLLESINTDSNLDAISQLNRME